MIKLGSNDFESGTNLDHYFERNIPKGGKGITSGMKFSVIRNEVIIEVILNFEKGSNLTGYTNIRNYKGLDGRYFYEIVSWGTMESKNNSSSQTIIPKLITLRFPSGASVEATNMWKYIDSRTKK